MGGFPLCVFGCACCRESGSNAGYCPYALITGFFALPESEPTLAMPTETAVVAVAQQRVLGSGLP